MRRRRTALALTLGLLPGCMTMIDVTSNHPDRLGVYGGTRTFFFADTAASRSWACLGPFVFFPIDLPLSLVLDTLLLPITIPYTFAHRPPPPTRAEEAGERVIAGRRDESVDDLLLAASSTEVNGEIRARAVSRLATHPEAADRAVPVLIAIIRRDEPWRLRGEAVKALDRLGATDVVGAEIPALLEGAPASVAGDGALVIVMRRHPARLLEVLQGPAPSAVAAARLFGALAPVDDEVARALVAALDDEGDSYPGSSERALADAAADALAKTVTPGATRLLLEAGVRGSVAARVRIVALIGGRPTLGPEEEDFLLAALANGPPAVRGAAAVHVDKLPQERVLPALLRALDEDGNMAALDGLAALGPDAAPALPSIVRALGADWTAHEAACRALGAIGPAARPAVPELLASLEQPRVTALPVLEALGRIGGPEAARFLLGRLFTSDARERDAAFTGLVAADPRCEVTGPDLVALVLDRAAHWEQRVRAVAVLDRAGANQPAVLAALDRVAYEHPEGWSSALCYAAKEAHFRLSRR